MPFLTMRVIRSSSSVGHTWRACSLVLLNKRMILIGRTLHDESKGRSQEIRIPMLRSHAPVAIFPYIDYSISIGSQCDCPKGKISTCAGWWRRWTDQIEMGVAGPACGPPSPITHNLKVVGSNPALQPKISVMSIPE